MIWRWHQVGQHPLACLKASRSWSNHRHLLRRIGLDDDGIEQPINPSQWIVERKSYGLNTPF
ncbi:MAG TPA: hypothetical protein VNW73_04420 [Ktedonobacteraceae bacterium]|nr:hypothetical protein [Ktedonobacteraceae bacterium]